MIEIGENKALSSDQKQRVVVVLARTHAGESPSSFVVQGKFNNSHIYKYFDILINLLVN